MRKKIARDAWADGLFALNLAMPRDQRERLEIVLEEGVKRAFLFRGGQAPHFFLRRAKDAGAVVMQPVAAPEEAQRAGAPIWLGENY